MASNIMEEKTLCSSAPPAMTRSCFPEMMRSALCPMQ